MAQAYARRSFNGGAIATTVPNGIGASDTSFTLALATNWSFANNFFVDVDRGLPTEEKILCSGISGLTVTVASGGRGADGSSAVQHLAGCTIQVVHVAQDDDEANQVVSGILGQSGVAKGDMSYILSAAGPNTLARLPIGSAGQLIGVSAGVPFWTSITAAQVGAIFTAAGQLIVGTGAGTGATLGSATAGYLLTSTGATGVPVWSAPVNAMTLISSQVLGATASSITFSAIPGTYNHLRLVAEVRSTASQNSDQILVRVNGDSSGHYDVQETFESFSATAPGTQKNASQTSIDGSGGGALMPAASATAGAIGLLTIDIPLYAGTTFFKVITLETFYSDLANSLYYKAIDRVTYKATPAAITSVSIANTSGSNWTIGSAGYLYGIT